MKKVMNISTAVVVFVLACVSSTTYGERLFGTFKSTDWVSEPKDVGLVKTNLDNLADEVVRSRGGYATNLYMINFVTNAVLSGSLSSDGSYRLVGYENGHESYKAVSTTNEYGSLKQIRFDIAGYWECGELDSNSLALVNLNTNMSPPETGWVYTDFNGITNDAVGVSVYFIETPMLQVATDFMRKSDFVTADPLDATYVGRAYWAHDSGRSSSSVWADESANSLRFGGELPSFYATSSSLTNPLNLASGSTVAPAMNANHPVSLEQMNTAIAAVIPRSQGDLYFRLGLTNASPVSYQMLGVPNQTSVMTATVTSVTNTQYAISIVSTAQLTKALSAGELFEVNYYANRGVAGSVTITPEFYLVATNGSFYTELPSGAGVSLGTTISSYEAYFSPTNSIGVAGDRYGVRFKVSGVSGSPTINFYSGSGYLAHLSLPTITGSGLLTQSDIVQTLSGNESSKIPSAVVVASSLATKADLDGWNLTNLVSVLSTNVLVISGATNGYEELNGMWSYSGIINGKPSYADGGIVFFDDYWYVDFVGLNEQISETSINYYPWDAVPLADCGVWSQGTELVPASGEFRTNLDVYSKGEVVGLVGTITNGIIEQVAAPKTIGWALIGQSNAEGFPDDTNRLFSAAFVPLTNAFISYIGQYTTSDTNAIHYQTNLVYYDYTYNSTVSWGVELPIGHALAAAGYTNYIYKSGIGGAAPNSFTNGASLWKYVTNTYATAKRTWSNAPAPTFAVFMRGETGSDTQTQEQSYQERLATYNSLVAYYGNTNLQFIQTGLPGVYFGNSNGALVEAGAKQLCASNSNCHFVETHDIFAGHYDQDQMIEVANRIMVVVNKILAGKKHSQFEQFDKLGATEVIADEGQFRELKYKSRPLEEAIDIMTEDGYEDTNSVFFKRSFAIASGAVSTLSPSPVYSNGIKAVVRFEGVVTNAIPSGVTVGSEGVVFNASNFNPDTGSFITLTNTSGDHGVYFTDTALSNSDFSVSFWYRREFEPSTNDTGDGYAFHLYNVAGSGVTIGLATRSYVLPITSPNNYTILVTLRDINNVAVIGSGSTPSGWISDYPMALNVWNHYCFQLDRNGTSSVATFYVNGVLAKTWTPTNDLSATAMNTSCLAGVGATRTGNESYYMCDGSIDDFVYSSRILTQKEIVSLMRGQPIRGVE